MNTTMPTMHSVVVQPQGVMPTYLDLKQCYLVVDVADNRNIAIFMDERAAYRYAAWVNYGDQT